MDPDIDSVACYTRRNEIVYRRRKQDFAGGKDEAYNSIQTEKRSTYSANQLRRGVTRIFIPLNSRF